MSASRNPFLPVRGRILHDNADLVSEAGAIGDVPQGVQDIERALDELTDPELQLAARDYSCRLARIEPPAAPVPMPAVVQ